MADSALAAMVAAQNALATHKRALPVPNRPHALVRVLQDARYNGPDHKAQRAKAGDIIAVASGRYVADLVAAGLVELYVEDVPAKTEGNESEESSEDENDLSGFKMDYLRAMAESFGIDHKGLKKADLIEALQNP